MVAYHGQRGGYAVRGGAACCGACLRRGICPAAPAVRMVVLSIGTSAALHSYLAGRWSLTKRLDYSFGGLSGNFAGSASFDPLPASSGGISTADLLRGGTYLLLFSEEGAFTDDASSQMFEGGRRLLYDCTGENIVRVSFIDAPASDVADAAAARKCSRVFHDIHLSSDADVPPRLTDHPCGPDIYSGSMSIKSDELFELCWDVSGPRKVGRVRSTFSRLS